MPTARIITRFPERAASLRKILIKAGYHVEVVPPDCASEPADLEYDLEQMLEYASDAAGATAETQVHREFIFAPHWHALKAKFARPRKDADVPATRQGRAQSAPQPPPSLDERFVDSKAQGPSLGDRITARLSALTEKIHEKRTALEQQRAAKRAQMAEQRRIREAELAAKREAERIAAERARAEAALRVQEQREREAKRLAEIQAQMELRRQAEERAHREAEERARLVAEQRARSEAERIRTQPAMPIRSGMHEITESRPVTAQEPWGHHEIRRRFSELQEKAKATMQDWHTVERSDSFGDTRQYAWRQAIPIATGIALAFVLGWATAIGGSKMRVSDPQPATQTAVAPSAVSAPVTAKPPAHKVQKPSPVRTVQANTHKAGEKRLVQRDNSRQDEEAFDDEQEVIVRHHYPGKATVAKNNKGVKTISDIE